MNRNGTRPIRVLFVNDHLGYPGGVVHGGGVYLTTLLQCFDRTEVVPAVAILRRYHPTAERLRNQGVSVTFFDRGKWDPRALFDLVRFTKQQRIELLHLNGMKSHFLGRLAAAALAVPAIIHLHFRYQPFPAFLQATLARHTALALSVSRILKNHAVEAFRMPPNKVRLVYNPLDVQRFSDPDANARISLRRELGLGEDQPVIAVIGRVVHQPEKGQKTLIRSMPEILSRHPNAVLTVVGDGDALPECRKIAEVIGVDGNIRFLGQRQDIPKILAMVDLVVVPSEQEEAFPYVILEAMSAGRPVIGSEIGGIPEALDNGSRGILVKPGDRRGFAAAICRLLDTPAAGDFYVARAKHYVQNFTVERHTAQLTEIYKTIVPVSE